MAYKLRYKEINAPFSPKPDADTITICHHQRQKNDCANKQGLCSDGRFQLLWICYTHQIFFKLQPSFGFQWRSQVTKKSPPSCFPQRLCHFALCISNLPPSQNMIIHCSFGEGRDSGGYGHTAFPQWTPPRATLFTGAFAWGRAAACHVGRPSLRRLSVGAPASLREGSLRFWQGWGRAGFDREGCERG